ncbi:MAG: hypothetical protein HY597_02645 [Candidatus Omnitrophica bacterium]|nr:hypothetical protein [Candidatus Omnitrophota bacterium]
MTFKRQPIKQLGELLLSMALITREQLEQALALQKTKGGLLGQILVDLGYVTEDQIAQSLTAQYGFPYLPLRNYEVDAEVLKLIPENVAKQYCLIPVDLIGQTITIAMANPLNTQAIEDVELMTKCKVQAFVSTASDVNGAIVKYYNGK